MLLSWWPASKKHQRLLRFVTFFALQSTNWWMPSLHFTIHSNGAFASLSKNHKIPCLSHCSCPLCRDCNVNTACLVGVFHHFYTAPSVHTHAHNHHLNNFHTHVIVRMFFCYRFCSIWWMLLRPTFAVVTMIASLWASIGPRSSWHVFLALVRFASVSVSASCVRCSADEMIWCVSSLRLIL